MSKVAIGRLKYSIHLKTIFCHILASPVVIHDLTLILVAGTVCG